MADDTKTPSSARPEGLGRSDLIGLRSRLEDILVVLDRANLAIAAIKLKVAIDEIDRVVAESLADDVESL